MNGRGLEEDAAPGGSHRQGPVTLPRGRGQPPPPATRGAAAEAGERQRGLATRRASGTCPAGTSWGGGGGGRGRPQPRRAAGAGGRPGRASGEIGTSRSLGKGNPKLGIIFVSLDSEKKPYKVNKSAKNSNKVERTTGSCSGRESASRDLSHTIADRTAKKNRATWTASPSWSHLRLVWVNLPSANPCG